MLRPLPYVITLGLLLGGTGAYAQGAASQTQNPPSPNAQNSQMGMSPNSLPAGGATGAVGTAGGAINRQATQPSTAYSGETGSGMNTLHPMHAPRHRVVRRRARHVTHPASSDASPLVATTSVS